MPLKEIFAAILMGGGGLAVGLLVQEYVFYAHDRKRGR